MTTAQHAREGGPNGAALSSHPVAATALLAAAAIHAAEIVPHGSEWVLAGGFFAVLTIAQAAFGLLLLSSGPPRWIRIAIIVVSLGAALTWVMSRTIGLPIGPHAGLVEPVGTRDALVTGLEVIAIAALTQRRGTARPPARPVPRLMRAGIALGVLLAGTSGAFAHEGLAPSKCITRHRSPVEFLVHAHEHHGGTEGAPDRACHNTP